MVWNEIAASGDRHLDEEHKALFNQANQILTSGMQERPKADIEALLEHTLEMISTHFSDEEAILRKTTFPGTARHVQRHHELLAKAEDLSTRFARDEINIGILFGFLAYDVVAHHIMSEDREFFPFLHESPAQVPVREKRLRRS